MRISNRPNILGRLALAALAVAAVGLPTIAAIPSAPQAQTDTVAQQSTITKVVFKQERNRLIISGTGLDENVTVRVNGREVTGERKFKADKGKLRITVQPDQLGLKASGQNRVEVLRNDALLGESSF